MKKLEFKSSKGFLREIEMTDIIKIKDGVWLDAQYIETLLLIDEVWKTARQIKKRISIDKTDTEFRTFLKYLVDNGFIERRRINSKHIEFRRKAIYPKHHGGQV